MVLAYEARQEDKKVNNIERNQKIYVTCYKSKIKFLQCCPPPLIHLVLKSGGGGGGGIFFIFRSLNLLSDYIQIQNRLYKMARPKKFSFKER